MKTVEPTPYAAIGRLWDGILVSLATMFAATSGCGIPSYPAVCEVGRQAETQCEEARLGDQCFHAILNLYEPLVALLDLIFPGDGDTTLDEIPEGLQFVLADRARFDATGHPLTDAVLGMGGEGSSGLDGCWARVQTMRYADDSAEWVEAEFMTIDLDNALIVASRMKSVDGNPCSDDPRPYILVLTDRIVALADEHFTITGAGDFDAETTAGLNPDGSLSENFIARIEWEFADAPPFDRLFALDGDFLATSTNRGGFGPLNRDLWIRLDCSEVGAP